MPTPSNHNHYYRLTWLRPLLPILCPILQLPLLCPHCSKALCERVVTAPHPSVIYDLIAHDYLLEMIDERDVVLPLPFCDLLLVLKFHPSCAAPKGWVTCHCAITHWECSMTFPLLSLLSEHIWSAATRCFLATWCTDVCLSPCSRSQSDSASAFMGCGCAVSHGSCAISDIHS